MADEAIGNGVASDFDEKAGEEHGIAKHDLDFGKDADVLELKRKIEALEQEKFGLVRGKEESEERIRFLTEEIEGLKKDGAAMKERLDEMMSEIDRSYDDKKTLKAIATRAEQLETELFRAQHELISTSSESQEVTEELGKLKVAFDELKQSNLEKESKIEALEKEKASLLERIGGEVEQMKKLKAEREIRIRYLEEKIASMEAREVNDRDQNSKLEEDAKAKISEKDSEILQLQKVIERLESKVLEGSSDLQKLQKEKDEIEKLKCSLAEDLEQSQKKFIDMETKANRLENELDELKKSNQNLNCTSTARTLDAEDVKGSKGLNLQWPTAVASTGTVAAAAAAALFYLGYTRRR